jgi:hypothetical protein
MSAHRRPGPSIVRDRATIDEEKHPNDSSAEIAGGEHHIAVDETECGRANRRAQSPFAPIRPTSPGVAGPKIKAVYQG